MAQDLLYLVQGAPLIDQEGGVLMPQIMQPQVRQTGIIAQSCPYLVYRGKWFTSTSYKWVVIFTPRAQVFKDGVFGVIGGSVRGGQDGFE